MAYNPYSINFGKKTKNDLFSRPDVAPEAATAKYFESLGANTAAQQAATTWKEAPKFDYSGAISNNPYLKETQAEIAAGNIKADADRLMRAQRAFIGAGYEFNPDELGAAQGFNADQIARLKSDFSDPAFLELLRKNNQAGLSTAAQIEQGSRRDLAARQNRLAARGILSGGAATHAAQRVAEERKLADYAARAKALNIYQDVNQTYDDYVAETIRQEREAARRAAEQAAVEGAAFEQANPYVPPPPLSGDPTLPYSGAQSPEAAARLAALRRSFEESSYQTPANPYVQTPAKQAAKKNKKTLSNLIGY